MKNIITFLAGLLLCSPVFGAYLTDVPVTITQPDGTVIQCFASGDEYYHWLHDGDGYTIVSNGKTGYYCYAVLAGEELRASSFIVGQVDPKTTQLQARVNLPPSKIKEIVNDYLKLEPEYKPANNSNQHQQKIMGGLTLTRTLNNIVIYVRFYRDPGFSNGQSYYIGRFNTDSISMRNYFKKASYNQLDIVSHFFPITNKGNTITCYTDDYTRKYYTPYDSISNVNGYQTGSERKNRERTLVANAINAIKSQIPSTLNIDSDNDEYVDNVCLIIQGNATEKSTLLWPHKSSLPASTNVMINGKKVKNYNVQIEDIIETREVAVLSHEMNHSLGAPDLYHSNNDSNPVGLWDLMATPPIIPPHMGAYMKYKYGHWISSIPAITTTGTYTLKPITSSTNNCYKIPIKKSNEYFVLEYRLKIPPDSLPNNLQEVTDVFEDNALNYSGLLIYRIDEQWSGNINGEGHGGHFKDEVYLFRPDGTINEEGNIYLANFSNIDQKWPIKTEFHNTSNPHSFISNGNNANIYIGNITEHHVNNQYTISFDVRFCDNQIQYSNTNALPPETNAASIVTNGNVTVKSTDNIKFKADDYVELNGGFETVIGGTFEILPQECDPTP